MDKGDFNSWEEAVKFYKEEYKDLPLEEFLDRMTMRWEDGEIFKENKCGFNQWGDREIIVTLSDNQKVGPFCFNSCNKCD